MATTERITNHRGSLDDRSSRDLQREIEQTRHQMDETLEEIGERLNPRHLFDELLDMFKSSGTGSDKRRMYAQQARKAGKQLVCKMKEHPVPSLLMGAGIAWMLYEEFGQDDLETRRRRMHAQWADIPEYSGSFVDARTGEPYDVENYGAEWKGVAAWSDDYDWSKSHTDKESWTERATRALSDIKSMISDTTFSARDKIQWTASKLMGLSGRKRRDLHSQWANLREHSGSFVDARTGEPYSADYGAEFQNLSACDFAASHDWSEEDEASWSEKAQHVIEEIQSTLASSASSTKDQLRSLSSHIGSFVGSTRDMAADYGSRARDQARTQGAWLRDRSRRAAGSLQHQMQHGYSVGRDQFTRAVDESPLAVGAAFLGLGLIAGLLIPTTESEDALMGETSDRLKRQARDAGKEIVERGQRVASATAEAVAEHLEQEGLTPHEMAEKARHMASEVKETVKHQAADTAAEMKEKFAGVAQRATDTAKQEVSKQKEEMQG